MRNTEAQRYARWSLAVTALLALAVAGVYLRNVYLARQAEKKAPPAVPPTIEQLSNEFSFSKVEGQRTIYTVRASRATEFKEGGRNLLEDVDISVYGKRGDRNDTVRTRACDFISNTGKISCAGDVQINLQTAGAPHASANAIQVKTSAVTFNRDSGAVGVSYDSNSGTLRLEHSVELNLAPSSPAVPGKTEARPEKIVHLTGDAMSFQREKHLVQMEGNVVAEQAVHELLAEKLQLDLDAMFRARHIVASGHPQMHDSGTQGPLALNADEIAADLRPDGSVGSIVATGSVHGTRMTPAGVDGVDAGRLQIDLATRQDVPRILMASDGVTLTSAGQAPNSGTRRVETAALEIHFSSRSRPGGALMESVNTLAPARVEWRSDTTVNGKAVPQMTRMAGKQMNLKFEGQNQLRQLVSTGNVEVTRKLGDGPEQMTTSHDLTAKFDGAGEWTTIDQTGDVHFRDGQRTGQGERAHDDHAANTVTLTGSVVISDAATRTTAQSASFVQGTNTLRAEGHVLTSELRSAAASVSNFSPEPARISADHLVADTVRGHAMYSGSGRLWQGQSVIEADTIELDDPSHTLLAKGEVRGVFPQAAWTPKLPETSTQLTGQTSGRPATKSSTRSGHPEAQLGHANGDMLTYWEMESRARIEQNARVESEQGSIQAHQIDLYFSDSGDANGTKQLTRAVATGDVAVRQEGRRGTSQRAEYTASEGKFVLSEGKPTLYSSTGDSTVGRQLTFYFADDRIVVDSAEGSKTVTLHQVEK